jgi:hypothetical protein
MKRIIISFIEEILIILLSFSTQSGIFKNISLTSDNNSSYKFIFNKIYLVIIILRIHLIMHFFTLLAPFNRLYQRLINVNKNSKPILINNEYDYIIAGAGHAGCYIAKKLLDKGYTVLIICQQTQIDPKSKYPSNAIFDFYSSSSSDTTFQNGKKKWFYQRGNLAFLRSLLAGGTLNTSFGKVVFHNEKLGENVLENWGIKLSEVPKKHPFIKECYRLFQDVKYAKTPTDGLGKYISTYDSLIMKYKNSDKLTILRNKNVLKLEKDSDNISKILLEDSINYAKQEIINCDDSKVILSCGPLANPQILYKSFQIKEFPIRDHPCISLIFDIREENNSQTIRRKLLDKIKQGNNINRNLMYEEIDEIQSNITEAYTYLDTDTLLIFANNSIAATTYKNPRHNFRDNCVSVFVAYVGEMDENAQGTYTFDENGYNIETEWHTNEKIVNTLWKGAKHVRQKLGCYQEYDKNKRDTKEKFTQSLKDYIGVLNSTNGTCSELIDEEYKYKNADNLFICDSSTLQENPSFRPLGITLEKCELFTEQLSNKN